MPLLRPSSSCILAASLLAAVSIAVTGCSFNPAESAQLATSGNISGTLHGGPNPIVGATVTLYATQSGGYGGAGLQLAQVLSTSTGGFSFSSSSYTCPAGQFAYVTAAGGNTGANSANANSVLLAALGPCSGLSTATNIFISEPTTIAAAYALSNFITVSGTGATTVVGISAPANNNGGASLATSGACTGTGAGMTCYAAGLRHAFLNAANLVSASNISGVSTSNPTGTAYSTPPSNPTTTATAVALQNIVPAQLINSLANSVQACVNSNGTTGSTDTTSGCGQFFTATTVPTTFSSNTTFTTKPTNTLQALVNLAKFPFMTTTAVGNIFSLGSGTSFYQPSLTSAPPDFSISIIFRSYASAANQLGSVYYTTTDINDNVYATALTGSPTGSLIGAVPYIAHALSSNGVGNWSTPATLLASSTATYTCDANAGTAATSGACFAATDTAGHVYFGLGANSLAVGGLWQVASASGAVTQFSGVNAVANFPYALAVDRSNNLFYSGINASANNLFQIPAGAAATVTPTTVQAGGTNIAAGHLSDSLVFDTAGNLWGPAASGSNVGFNYFPNTGSLTTETFGAGNICNCLGGTTNKWVTGGMIDASANYWLTTQNGYTRIANGPTNAPGVTGGGSTGVSTYSPGSQTTTVYRISSMDGSSNIFVPDNNTSSAQNEQSGPPTAPNPALDVFFTTLSTPAQAIIQGCNVGAATGNTTCILGNVTTNASPTPNNGMFYQAVNAAIDATGSMWVSSEANDAVIQVIGTATPVWPQVSYLKPSVEPQ